MEHALPIGNWLETLICLAKDIRSGLLREHFVVACFTAVICFPCIFSAIFRKHLRKCALVVSMQQASEILMEEQIWVSHLFWLPELLNTL